MELCFNKKNHIQLILIKINVNFKARAKKQAMVH